MFEIILFGLVCLCGVIIVLCRYVFTDISKRSPEPFYLDYARSFFPVLLLVFLLRGFVAEPFRIPSGSMLPTLEIGDFILVNKFSYGVRLPILHDKIISIGSPKRGDIMVFRVPTDNQTSYIKRVIGLPGDTIEYRDRTLFVNGERVQSIAQGDYVPFGRRTALNLFTQIIEIGAANEPMVEYSALQSKRPRYRRDPRSWVVPEGEYFMMGDNRDNSQDSRVWGFVPDENIIGKAFFVWFHYNSAPNGGVKFSRVGQEIKAQPVQ